MEGQTDRHGQNNLPPPSAGDNKLGRLAIYECLKPLSHVTLFCKSIFSHLKPYVVTLIRTAF